jgi:hypothetical protein
MLRAIDLMIKVLPAEYQDGIHEDCGDTCSVTDTSTPFCHEDAEGVLRRQQSALATLKEVLRAQQARKTTVG